MHSGTPVWVLSNTLSDVHPHPRFQWEVEDYTDSFAMTSIGPLSKGIVIILRVISALHLRDTVLKYRHLRVVEVKKWNSTPSIIVNIDS